jgi:Cu-processing system permease protein
MSPVITIAHLTLIEARRRRILLASVLCGLAFVLLFAVALLVVGRTISEDGAGPLGRRFAFLGFTLAGLYVANNLAMITAAILAVDTLSGEIASGLIQTLVSKPVRRGEILLGKWIAFEIVIAAYIVLTAGGVAFAAWAVDRLVLPHLWQGLLLMLLGATVMLTVSMAASTRLSTMTAGIAALGIYGIAFLGGWIEQIGTSMPLDDAAKLAARDIGTITSLLSPTDVLWRLAAFQMMPPLARSLPAGPFGTSTPASAAMIVWAAGYVVVMLVIALRQFSRRPL